MVMYISLALGYRIRAGDISGLFAEPLCISSEDYNSIISFISKFADLPSTQQAATESSSSTASAQLAARQLLLQLKHNVKPTIH